MLYSIEFSSFWGWFCEEFSPAKLHLEGEFPLQISSDGEFPLTKIPRRGNYPSRRGKKHWYWDSGFGIWVKKSEWVKKCRIFWLIFPKILTILIHFLDLTLSGFFLVENFKKIFFLKKTYKYALSLPNMKVWLQKLKKLVDFSIFDTFWLIFLKLKFRKSFRSLSTRGYSYKYCNKPWLLQISKWGAVLPRGDSGSRDLNPGALRWNSPLETIWC